MAVVNTVLGFVRDYLLQPAIRHTGYALHVKAEIEKLRDEMEILMAIEKDVGRKMETAHDPLNVVQVWQSRVKRLIEKVEPDLRTDLNCGHYCPNFLSRYKLGKRVAKQYLIDAKQLILDGRGFDFTIDLNLPVSAEANFEALCEEVNTLSHIEADVNSMVEKGKRVQGLQSNYRVEDWLQRVIAHKRDVAEICSEFQERIKGSENDGERKVSDNLNLRMHEILEKIKALGREGQGFVSNVSVPSRPVQVVSQSEITPIGQDKAFRDVQYHIQSGNSGIIGIYGMGGVGKTTLLKRINNSLVGLDYEIVMFVVVSKDGNIGSVQKDILKRMGKDADHTSTLPSENIIRNWLQDKKFILLLDDIWNKLNLEDVGVPIDNCKNNSNSKILFTTRFENVCDQMEATKVKIECLYVKEAWELFERTVGASFINSNFGIKEVAEDLAKECGGLPLALTVIGAAMRSKRTIEGWQHALTTLRKARPELTGTEEDLYNRLRFSYDSLPNDIMKECFCYCALFPEDYEIVSSDIVGCWIGEGFFDDCDNIDEARNKGYDIIEGLKQACLLERVMDYVDDLAIYGYVKVKLHDVVRDMALWIKKSKFAVVTTGAKVPKMEEVERLSIMISDGELRDLNQIALVCPKLSTFLIGQGLVDKLSHEFFQGMTNLKVLMFLYKPDMSKCGRLPSSIRNLVKLRYLNLGPVTEKLLGSWELGELQSLEQLTVAIITYEVEKSLGVIGRLSNLRVLDLLTSYGFGTVSTDYGVKIEPALKSLRYIEDLALPIRSSSALRELAASPKLAHSVSRLHLRFLLDTTSFVLASEVGSMSRLKNLMFYKCQSLEKIVMEEEDDRVNSTSQQDRVFPPRSSPQYPELTLIRVTRCHGSLHTVMCVGITQHIFIQRLQVVDCIKVEQVFKQCTRSEGSAEYVFQALQQIELNHLSNLKSICSDAFTFPHLEVLIVFRCPKLKKLPRGIIQASKGALLREIRGEREWWDGLEWDSEDDKSSILPFFIPHDRRSVLEELLTLYFYRRRRRLYR